MERRLTLFYNNVKRNNIDESITIKRKHQQQLIDSKRMRVEPTPIGRFAKLPTELLFYVFEKTKGQSLLYNFVLFPYDCIHFPASSLANLSLSSHQMHDLIESYMAEVRAEHRFVNESTLLKTEIEKYTTADPFYSWGLLLFSVELCYFKHFRLSHKSTNMLLSNTDSNRYCCRFLQKG